MLVSDIRFSMLSPAVLEKLAEYARIAEGGIVEVGPYIGGSTVALAIGHAGAKPHAVIEVGGQYLAHPTLPSADIIADWRTNVGAAGLSRHVALFEGWSYQASLRRAVIAHVGGIGLLFADADGYIDPLLARFAADMRDDCLLVFDDYVAPGAPEKQALVQDCVDRNMARGFFVEDARVGATWFGRLAGTTAKRELASYPAFMREQGKAFLALFEAACAFDVDAEGTRSPLRLFEDGNELGPAHTLHDEIREHGAGRFSHWSYYGGPLSALYFSSSDGSDPNTNGKVYHVDMGGGPVDVRLL